MLRTDITVPEFYQKYIDATEEDELIEAIERSTKQLRKLIKKIPKKKIDYAYAEGKWTIRELFQHMIDAERVFVFRAMWFARQDPSGLPGFDENTWATTAKASNRKWKELVREFLSLRESTLYFFQSLEEEQLQQQGTANNNILGVGALGFVCAGHVMHHINIIKERYLKDKGDKA